MVNLKKHIAYSKSPELFMKEQWLTFNSFNGMNERIDPFDFQIDFIRTIHDVPSNIIVKSRQMTLTSMVELYIAWYVLFNSEKTVAILAISSESGRNILDKIKIILQNYSVQSSEDDDINKYFHFENDFEKNNKTELILKNKCRIKVLTPSPHAGKGESIDFLYVDEAAFIKDFAHIWTCLGMRLNASKNSKTIIASTPKEDSYFNNIFLGADMKLNSFNPIRLHWSIHPEYSKGIKEINSPFYQYSSPWFEEICSRYGYNNRLIQQEFDCLVKYNEHINKSKTISLRLSQELYKKLEIKLKNNSVSDYIRELIEKDLDS